MSEAKHTPGPWSIESYCSISDEIVISKCENKHYVAHVDCDRSYSGYLKDEMDCNARLISAAPEMLEALKAITKVYIEIGDSGDAGYWEPREDPEVIVAMAAIAKAEGNEK